MAIPGQQQLVGAGTKAGVSALAAYAGLGAVAGPLGLVAGLAASQLIGSGAARTGPGSPGRISANKAFVARHQAMSLAENRASLANYLAKYKNCTKASDPASCRALAQLLQQIIDQQSGGAASLAPAATAYPFGAAPSAPVYPAAYTNMGYSGGGFSTAQPISFDRFVGAPLTGGAALFDEFLASGGGDGGIGTFEALQPATASFGAGWIGPAIQLASAGLEAYSAYQRSSAPNEEAAYHGGSLALGSGGQQPTLYDMLGAAQGGGVALAAPGATGPCEVYANTINGLIAQRGQLSLAIDQVRKQGREMVRQMKASGAWPLPGNALCHTLFGRKRKCAKRASCAPRRRRCAPKRARCAPRKRRCGSRTTAQRKFAAAARRFGGMIPRGTRLG